MFGQVFGPKVAKISANLVTLQSLQLFCQLGLEEVFYEDAFSGFSSKKIVAFLSREYLKVMSTTAALLARLSGRRGGGVEVDDAIFDFLET
jgi:hypothetical protein